MNRDLLEWPHIINTDFTELIPESHNKQSEATINSDN